MAESSRGVGRRSFEPAPPPPPDSKPVPKPMSGSLETCRYPNRTLVVRRIVVTTHKQAAHAPLVDDCWGNGESRKDIRRWPRIPASLAPERRFKFSGKSILLTPWRKDRRGERVPQRALVIGWITSEEPLSDA